MRYSGLVRQGLLKTVSITLLGFDLVSGSEAVHSTFLLREKRTGQVLSDVIELHYVELMKFARPSLRNCAPALSAGCIF